MTKKGFPCCGQANAERFFTLLSRVQEREMEMKKEGGARWRDRLGGSSY